MKGLMNTDTQTKAATNQKTTIVVNGKKETVRGKKISYEELVAIAFNGNPPTGENVNIVVTYKNGPDAKRKGTLVSGQSVKIQEGMRFNVIAADKS